MSIYQRAIGDATMDIIRSEHTKPLNLMEIKVSVARGMPANYLQLWMPIFTPNCFNKPSIYIICTSFLHEFF